ncbi:glycoside hydrolase family 32 protein [Streptomyces sp. NPDC019937]|uniref:glycoside hydrolase family 32 protein n=1 Tax=Streptomyces sp. NPDC019937 TaxID=3154787 RepID=UPI003402ED0F
MSSGRASRYARMRLMAAVATVCALSATPLAPRAVAANTPAYAETYRPQFHFTPQKNWMNDPNGLVYYEGEYHLFYQYNPNGDSWGDMSWGHAVSKDLVHWKELPLALSHDDEEMVFSGSAVVDWNNTTGFGTEKNPPMVAIYTSAYKNGGKQAQSLAYSTDRGRTWTKYQGNPVIDIGSANFRDPKVQWHAPTKSWLMTVSLSTEHKVRFYASKNLKDWELRSEFGPAGATGGVWECPDLFPLAVDGDKNNIKWVLVVNINPGGIAGGSAAQYFVGDFDGKKFTPEDKGTYTPPTGKAVQDVEGGTYGEWTATGDAFGTHVLADQFTAADQPAKSSVRRADWADYGKDYYAAVSWENAPGGKRYMIGWMNNWDYGQSVPTSPWRGAQSVPREMALRTVDGRVRLTSKPVDSLASLRQKRPATAAGVTVHSTSKPLTGPAARGKALDLEATFSLEDADRFGLKVRTGAGGEETVIGYDTTTQELYVDRGRSGAGDFNSTFPGVQTAPLKPKNGQVKLRILVDWSSVEVFGGSGEAVITDQIFPDPASTGVEVFAEGGTATLDHLRAWQLKSIWR